MGNLVIRAMLKSFQITSSFPHFKCKSHSQSARRGVLFGFTADKAMQMHKAIFRLLDRVRIFFFSFFFAAIKSCRLCGVHARGIGTSLNKERLR